MSLQSNWINWAKIALTMGNSVPGLLSGLTEGKETRPPVLISPASRLGCDMTSCLPQHVLKLRQNKPNSSFLSPPSSFCLVFCHRRV